MKILSVALLFLICLQTKAFTGDKEKSLALSGTVTDLNNHESLAGVKITVKETGFTTYSDLEGNFLVLIKTSSAVTLQFEYLSYQDETKVITTDNASKLQIELNEKE